jgi:hypothetical protein
VAGCPLNFMELCLRQIAALWQPAPGELHGASSTTRGGVVCQWVDNFTCYFPVPEHPACGGLTDGCPTCLTVLAQAEVLDEWWIDLCRQLGVSLNIKKHQRSAQFV